jgi:16S rRNA (cytidine1402-2'-O)-methyltransferase
VNVTAIGAHRSRPANPPMVQYAAFITFRRRYRRESGWIRLPGRAPTQAMSHAPPPTGTLSVVSTPIGNLEDITLRALRVLREADVIAAEDTRRTARLLGHFAIATPTISLHEHNEHARVRALASRLAGGQHVALVTDAGTPLLSDPGLLLVRTAIDLGARVEPIPGPSAILSALVASGLATDEFVFLGFPPNRTQARRHWYHRADSIGLSFIVFEAPHRLLASLQDALAALGSRQVVVCRELTKLHEEFVRGDLADAISRFQSQEPRGEFTLVFAATPVSAESPADLTDEDVWQEFCRLTNSGLTRRDAIGRLARRLGRSSRDIYASIERGKAILTTS